MKLVLPFLDTPIEFKEGRVEVLVVENPIALRRIIKSFTGLSDELVLSDDSGIIDFQKNAEYIQNPLSPDLSSKALASKISADAIRTANEMYLESAEVLQCVNNYGTLISSELDFSSTFSFVEDTEKLVKLLNFGVDIEGMGEGETLLEFMRLCRVYFKKTLFVILNLKSFLSNEEIFSFCKSVSYEKYNVLLIESFQAEGVNEFENTRIIDRDLCVIG